MKHEKETLEAVIAMRNQAHGALAKATANPADPNAMAALSVESTVDAPGADVGVAHFYGMADYAWVDYLVVITLAP